jgi:hypothetical protein
MPFSRTIREKALVAAARHCCVCHRYKGVKVEVHHIEPEEEGGSNGFENAISLCFDCHADAGHYNPRHPRGTRFSGEELRRHRDQWYRLVQEHALPSPVHDDVLYCRYLICRDFGIITGIAQGDLTKVPAVNPLLCANQVLSFADRLVSIHGETYRQREIWGERFRTYEEYLAARRGDPTLKSSNPERLPYFMATRVPTEQEMSQFVCPKDKIAALLMQSGIPPSDFCRVLVYEEECGGPHLYQEVYRLRPLWLVFLAVTNIMEKAAVLSDLHCVSIHPSDLGFRPFETPSEPEPLFLALPRAPVPPQATVLIPVALILGPIDGLGAPVWRTESQQIARGEWTDLIHTNLANLINDFRLVGPAHFPKGLRITSSPQSYQPVHDLDLQNVYILDRHWAAGSCPFLLFRSHLHRTIVFKGHLFAGRPNTIKPELVVVPDGIAEVIVAELEDEVTFIKSVIKNQKEIAANLRLQRGDCLRLLVQSGNMLEISGYYSPTVKARQLVDSPMHKNEALVQFLARTTQHL